MKQVLFLAMLVFMLACDDETPDDNPVDNFDRQAVLANWADQFIIPGYTDMANQTASLKNVISDFVSDPNITSYESVAAAWEQAYLSFQNISMYEIGKAEELRLTNNLNIYPADIDGIIENALGGNYNLDLPSQIATQGFPALDYLLFGIAEDQGSILNFYQTNVNKDAYLDYIQVLADRINELVQTTRTDWLDGYRDEFVNNSGNSASASMDKIVNDFIFYYEKHFRAGKVGIPAGVFSGAALPNNVESLYKEKFNRTLFNKALESLQNFFNGNADGNSGGLGLDDYLDYLEVEKDGVLLSELINKQFNTIRETTTELEEEFRDQIETDNSKMLNLYDKIQANVVPLKVDMLQALNINVDFVDADGD